MQLDGMEETDTRRITGIYSPGDSTASVPFGNITMGDTATLEIEIGGLAPGTEHDHLDVSGTATLGGLLRVVEAEGFVPEHGDSFEIPTAQSATGRFDRVEGAKIAADKTQAPVYDVAELTLVASLPSDADLDGTVDANDLAVRRPVDLWLHEGPGSRIIRGSWRNPNGKPERD